MEAICKQCGESVSGPDEKSVRETMARHEQKHKAKAVKK